MELHSRGAELLFQVLTECEEKFGGVCLMTSDGQGTVKGRRGMTYLRQYECAIALTT